MQRFRFRLERALQWQIRVCHMEEEKLRACRHAVSETEELVRTLQASSRVIEHEILSRSIITTPDLRALCRHRAKVANRERALMCQKREQTAAVHEQMIKLSSERNRRRLIEKLRERALHEFTIMVEREFEALALESHLAKWASKT